MKRPAVVTSALAVVWAIAAGGCGSKPDAGPADSAQFKQLVALYSAVVNSTGRPPASEAAFKEFLKTAGAQAVAAMKVGSVDELFVSQRDGKPIVVIYAQTGAKARGDVAAYEQEGVGGKRLVGFSLGMTEEVDDARFRELVPGKAGAAP